VELELEPVVLSDEVSQVLSSLEERIAACGATVERADADCTVRAHPASVRSVLHNVVGNALKFSKPGQSPRLTLSTAIDGMMCRMVVADEGIGIAEDHLPSIWRVFERLHGEEEYPGTGIGLAIVERSVRKMQGRVGVESEIGVGSRFWFELPIWGSE